MLKLAICCVLLVGCEVAAADAAVDPEQLVSSDCEKLCRVHSVKEYGEHIGGTSMQRAVYRMECKKTIEDFNRRWNGLGCRHALEDLGVEP
jgi:hypothetical protein